VNRCIVDTGGRIMADHCLGGWCEPFEVTARPRPFRLPVKVPAASFEKACPKCPHCGWPLEVTVYSDQWNTDSARSTGSSDAWGSAKTLGCALPIAIFGLAALLPELISTQKTDWSPLTIPAIAVIVSAYQFVRLGVGIWKGRRAKQGDVRAHPPLGPGCIPCYQARPPQRETTLLGEFRDDKGQALTGWKVVNKLELTTVKGSGNQPTFTSFRWEK
jgi:hypothetical protein